MADFDVVIRGGTIVDGSGSAPFPGDLAIRDGRIAQVGEVVGRGREEVDARGRLVTPGFVDIHTHYDGQATWDHRLSPSSNHGVTTVLAGNCGVGFAPCRAGDHELLIALMEGVEDIPEVVMAQGLPWNWETFPEYLDSLAERHFDIDIGTQIPHSALRVYVMGERGANRDPSTAADRERMTALVAEAVGAGAFGVSTSRLLAHVSRDGAPAPSVDSSREELRALGLGLREANAGVFQLIPQMEADLADEMAIIRDIARHSGRPLSFTLVQLHNRPQAYLTILSSLAAARAEGMDLRAQIFPRPVGVLFGLDLSLNPFSARPEYQRIADLPLGERIAIMRTPEYKARLLADAAVDHPLPLANKAMSLAGEMYQMADPIDYTPDPATSIASRAAAAGLGIDSFVYDRLMDEDGHAILYLPGANFHGSTLDAVETMLRHPDTVLGLGDGGAHYGAICDASFPTFLLTHWVRDGAGQRPFSIQWAVAALSRKPAEAVGMRDRGLLKPGLRADVNMIDLDRLELRAPRAVYDLPARGRRLCQEARGYDGIWVNGVRTYRNDAPTGALPGRLLRGPGYRPDRRRLESQAC